MKLPVPQLYLDLLQVLYPTSHTSRVFEFYKSPKGRSLRLDYEGLLPTAARTVTGPLAQKFEGGIDYLGVNGQQLEFPGTQVRMKTGVRLHHTSKITKRLAKYLL